MVVLINNTFPYLFRRLHHLLSTYKLPYLHTSGINFLIVTLFTRNWYLRLWNISPVAKKSNVITSFSSREIGSCIFVLCLIISSAQLGGGRSSLPFLKIEKSVLISEKKRLDCIHLWVKLSIQNVVLRRLRRKTPKFFPVAFLSCVFNRSVLIQQNLPCPSSL